MYEFCALLGLGSDWDGKSAHSRSADGGQDGNDGHSDRGTSVDLRFRIGELCTTSAASIQERE